MQFFDPDRWNEIWQTISRNRRRSVMTALSVFWGIFMLTVLLGAGAGLERLLARQIGAMSTNLVLMQSNRTSVPYKGMPSDRQWNLETEDVAAVKQLPEVRYAAGVNWGGSHPCSRQGRKGDYGVMGHTPDYQLINPEKSSTAAISTKSTSSASAKSASSARRCGKTSSRAARTPRAR